MSVTTRTSARRSLTPRTASRPGRRKQAWLDMPKGLVLLIVLLGLWQLLGPSFSLRFPRPSTWFTALEQYNSAGVLAPALARTIEVFLLGLVLSIVFGVAIGLLIGANQTVERSSGPFIDFCRGLPIPVIIPIVILIAGIGLWPSVFIIVFGTLWPVLLATVSARRSLGPVRMDVARMLRMGTYERLRKIIFPSILPEVIVGIRIASSLGVVTVLAVEMLGSDDGAGFLLLKAESQYDVSGMWGLLLLVGVFGFAMNYCLGLLENRILRVHALGK